MCVGVESEGAGLALLLGVCPPRMLEITCGRTLETEAMPARHVAACPLHWGLQLMNLRCQNLPRRTEKASKGEGRTSHV